MYASRLYVGTLLTETNYIFDTCLKTWHSKTAHEQYNKNVWETPVPFRDCPATVSRFARYKYLLADIYLY